MKLLEHRIRTVDTIQSIAATYLSDANRWTELVDFNNLDYPYISTDPAFKKDTSASGTLQLVRNYTVLILEIPKGTMFYSASNDGTPQRLYMTVRPYYMQAGEITIDVEVECTVPGVWGNVPSHAIAGLYAPSTTLQGAFKSIANPAPFSNGASLNVRALGDALLIPVEVAQAETYTNIEDYYERHFGSDITLLEDGDMDIDAYGDTGSVSGVDNLVQSINGRLETTKQELIYHREYGSILKALLQEGDASYIDKWIRLAVEEALLPDDRISAVNVVSITRVAKTLQVVVDVTPITQGEVIRVETGIISIS